MIPMRLKRRVDRVASQPDDVIEKKAKRMQFFTWFWLSILVLMTVEFAVGAVGTRTFLWTEFVAKTMPFLTMAALMASGRDTLLLVLLMKQRNSQPEDGQVSSEGAPSDELSS
jgi:hypothetical protein